MEQKENELWSSANLKNISVNNSTEIKDTVNQAIKVLSEFSSIPSSSETIKLLQRGIKKSALSVEDIKNLRSLVGKAEINAKGMDTGGIGRDIANEIGEIKNNLLSQMQSSIKSSAANPLEAAKTLNALSAASQFSSKLFTLKDESSRIRNALFDDVDARSVVKSMISEAEAINKGKTLGIMSKSAQDATVATKLAGALEAAGYPERRAVDIGRFLELTGRNTVVPNLMNGETHKAFIGMSNLLRSVQESSSHKMSKYLLAAGAVGAGGAVAAGAALPVGAALISYAAMASIANRSPLKSVFSALSNKLSPSVKESLSNKAHELMTRSGFFMNDEGILDINVPEKKKSGAPK